MLLRTPKIGWGASFANTIEIELLDNPIAYSAPREGSEWDEGGTGVEDAWILGTDQFLEGDVPFIHTNTGDNINATIATGWDGATGWRAFLEWARQKNQFRWYPDRTSGTFVLCYLVEPMNGAPQLDEGDGTRRLHLKIRTADDSPFTGY